MQTWYYEVVSIDGDYANLRRIDIPSDDLKLVARALLKTEGTGTKVISILRKFDPSLSIGEIRKRMQEDDFVVKYDQTI